MPPRACSTSAAARARLRSPWRASIPRSDVVGADVSPAAVELARRNAGRLGIPNVTFIESDWFASVPPKRFALIVANPPYVEAEDPHLGQGDLRFEPPAALVSGSDGLDAIRAIVKAAPRYLAAGGTLALEHGHDQAGTTQSLLREAGFRGIASARDLAGIQRVTYGLQ